VGKAAGEALKGLKAGEFARGITKGPLEEAGKAVEAAITRLKGLGATDEMINTILAKGGALSETYKAIKRTDSVKTVWIEEETIRGVSKGGWKHMVWTGPLQAYK